MAVQRLPDPSERDPGPEQQPDGPSIPSFLDRLLTAREFCALERTPRRRLLGPLWSEGQRIVIAGETGAGKSTWSYQALDAVVHRKMFLGYQGAGGRGLILDFEQEDEDVVDLLSAFGLDKTDDIDVLSIPYGVQLDKSPTERTWMQEVFEQGNYVAVLLDPLYKVFGGDSTNEREAVELMRHFDWWRSGAGGRWQPHGLLVPMHARKPPPKAPFTISEIFGSSAWPRGAEAVYGIKFVSNGFANLHAWKMRSHKGQQPEADEPRFRRGDVMGMTFEAGRGFVRAKARAKPVSEQIVDLLGARWPDGMTVEEFQEQIPGRKQGSHASRSTIDRALGELGDAVRSEPRGRPPVNLWMLSEAPPEPEEPPADDDVERWEGMAGE